MAETKTQSGQSIPSKTKNPQKPGVQSNPTPLTSRIENKRVINRLIDYFETKA
jgi:hypothetical protein